jgi:hypothetical protein
VTGPIAGRARTAVVAGQADANRPFDGDGSAASLSNERPRPRRESASERRGRRGNGCGRRGAPSGGAISNAVGLDVPVDADVVAAAAAAALARDSGVTDSAGASRSLPGGAR